MCTMGKPGHPMTALEYTGGTERLGTRLPHFTRHLFIRSPIEAQSPLYITFMAYDAPDMYERPVKMSLKKRFQDLFHLYKHIHSRPCLANR
jgi:hypothetical protein